MKKLMTVAAFLFLSFSIMAQNGSGTCDGTGPSGTTNQGSNQGSNPDGSGHNGDGAGSGPIYDISLEDTLVGEISTIVFANCDGTQNSGYQIVLDVDSAPVYLVLAPTPFLLLQELTFTTGETITVTGVYMEKEDGTEVFVVRTLTFESGEIVSFRDETGSPLWRALGRS